jgi:hypothetical protein
MLSVAPKKKGVAKSGNALKVQPPRGQQNLRDRSRIRELIHYSIRLVDRIGRFSRRYNAQLEPVLHKIRSRPVRNRYQSQCARLAFVDLTKIERQNQANVRLMLSRGKLPHLYRYHSVSKG